MQVPCLAWEVTRPLGLLLRKIRVSNIVLVTGRKYKDMLTCWNKGMLTHFKSSHVFGKNIFGENIFMCLERTSPLKWTKKYLKPMLQKCSFLEIYKVLTMIHNAEPEFTDV